MSSFLQQQQHMLSTNTNNTSTFQNRMSKILQCPVCLDTLCMPVTTPCGHNFCAACLDQSLRRQKHCPICRSVCSFSVTELVENKMLSELCESLDPVKYANKLLKMNKQMKEWKNQLPIFFYNSYEFPGTLISLHLFESRYRLMVKRIIHTSRKFIFLPNFTSYTANENDVGLLCELAECQILADGRAMLTAKCIGRIKILETWVENGTQGLSYCKCEDYNDLPLEDSDQERAVHEMRLKVSQQLVQHHSDAMKDFAVHHGTEPADDVDFSFWTSNFLSQELQKENYLTQSTYERMKAVYDTVMGYAYKEKHYDDSIMEKVNSSNNIYNINTTNNNNNNSSNVLEVSS